VSNLGRVGLPVITHVHELSRLLRAVVGEEGIQMVIAQSKALLAVSGAVRKMLIEHGAHDEHIVDVPEPIADTARVSPAERAALRREVLGVDDDTVVVVGGGLPSLRKGTDLFIPFVQQVLSQLPSKGKIAFRWVGGQYPNEMLSTLVDDIEEIGLGSQVAVIQQRRDADRLFAAADIFVSTSREDPNPLVVLEAAAGGCPIVCFSGAGGSEELAARGGGLAVPYLDTTAMAAAVSRLAQTPEERAALGAVAQRLVVEQNSPAAVGERVAMVLQNAR
jgi:glycosyltransferase involved in cell wall biosynthesis